MLIIELGSQLPIDAVSRIVVLTKNLRWVAPSWHGDNEDRLQKFEKVLGSTNPGPDDVSLEANRPNSRE